jgi:hypothetical protein
MSLLGGSLYNPELLSDHPVTITPALDVADGNPMVVSETQPLDFPKPSFRGDAARVGVSEWKATEAYDIAWPLQKGAKLYRLYASMSPVGHGFMVEDNIVEPATRFYPPYFTESVAYFFWIQVVDAAGKATWLTDVPSSLMATREKLAFFPNPITDDPCFYPAANELNCEMAKALSYIRSGDRLQLELNAEPAWLYLRRHAEDRPWGIPCSCTDSPNNEDDPDSDPDMQGKGRCKLCFGTGIFGGFLPHISIAIRYGNAPEQNFVHTKRGFQLEHKFNTYMLWLPTVRVGDLIVRQDGSRYEVVKSNPDISTRGVRLHQEFDLQQVEKTDILMEVTDKAIQRSLDKAKLPDFLKAGYKSFG